MEDVLIAERGGARACTGVAKGGKSAWRNTRKHEMLDLQRDEGRLDGLRHGLSYRVKAVRFVNADVSVWTVDLQAAEDPFATPMEEGDVMTYTAEAAAAYKQKKAAQRAAMLAAAGLVPKPSSGKRRGGH